MTYAELVKRLLAEQDLKYRDFHASLLPNIDKKTIIGVRVPTMRKIAKEFAAAGSAAAKTVPADVARFLDKLPHKYFEENQVHLLVVERIKDTDECLRRIEQFLPYIDNWAVCDGKSPKALLRDEARFLARIKAWLKSREPYTVRFGVNMLMNFFLDERFDKKHLEMVAAIDENLFDDSDTGAAGGKVRATDRYYVQMVIAWYFATALAKQWNATFPYIKNRRLSPWIHAKTIQKACESYRITDEQKKILRALK
ncbi:DNA alkylation repair enzyme [Fibrobacter sp. UWR3]|uniref:DNA alkylation repair protein n=1 Tax=Fibrobacter sp. UWR3 TaxID=1896217 RepID=UPI000910CA62|nr:DNA alkylation repair protein [Fibrobacter sp. UWR3]SHM19611.1 DNA alkylation repair enzyme [Fibrobacter sp. UWR3]